MDTKQMQAAPMAMDHKQCADAACKQMDAAHSTPEMKAKMATQQAAMQMDQKVKATGG